MVHKRARPTYEQEIERLTKRVRSLEEKVGDKDKKSKEDSVDTRSKVFPPFIMATLRKTGVIAQMESFSIVFVPAC